MERAEAVTAVRGGADFAAVSASFKRIKNILAQANFALDENTGYAMGGYVEGTDPESMLARKSAVLGQRVQELREKREYIAALEAVATIRPEVDAFFDAVMVNDPDPKVRERRLMLLALVLRFFGGIADFSEIVVGG